MPSATRPLVLFCTAESAAGTDLRGALEQAGLAVHSTVLPAPLPDLLPAVALLVLDGSASTGTALAWCRRMRALAADRQVPLLLAGGDPATRRAGLEAGADVCLPAPFTTDDLVAQVQALARLRQRLEWHEERSRDVGVLTRRLQQAHERLDRDVALAGRVRHRLVPRSLPEVPPARFAAWQSATGPREAGFYDVLHLPGGHVGFYLARSMCSEVAAGLLTAFTRHVLTTRSRAEDGAQLPRPDEVLQQLNEELRGLDPEEGTLLTLLYGVLDCRSLTLSFARAGQPGPLYVPRQGEVVAWPSPGGMLGTGVLGFRAVAHTLQPGDKVVLHTGELAATGERERVGRLAELVTRQRQLPAAALVQHLAGELGGAGAAEDGVTLLVLEIASA